jgi:hypothetical protein
MHIPDIRDLTQNERSLLERLLLNGTSASKKYVEQVPLVTVVSRCGCGCPTIDLAVGGRGARLRSPTEILSEAGGLSPEGVRFGIILHAREGLLSELEVYSVPGDARICPSFLLNFSQPNIRPTDQVRRCAMVKRGGAAGEGPARKRVVHVQRHADRLASQRSGLV